MRRLGQVLREQYGEKVYKLTLSSGCSCPNRDGSIGTGGCSFCSAGGSGDFAAAFAPIGQQLEEAKARIRQKTAAKKFIAYFQAFTNTYGDPERLEKLYEEVLRREEIVALSLGTRPDCLGEEILGMLRRLQAVKPVWLELGLQTVHEETARRIHRSYELPVFEESYRRLKREGFPVIVHLIFSLPGESREDMLESVRYLAALDPPPDGVKLQMLHVLRGTELGEEYLRQPFPLLSLEDYAELIAESAAILPEETVFHRVTGDGPGKLLIAPDWTRNKKRVLNTINARLREQGE